MRAIILAAGRGSRLSPVTGQAPKCLVRLGDQTLLERQIVSLRNCGITAITVVTGWQASAVAAVCRPAADVLENLRFAETNSLYSLWLARPLLEDGFVVLNGDVLFHPQLLADLLTARFEDALLVAYQDAGTPLGDEEMKVQVRAGRVVRLSKQMPLIDADGENVGIAKFGPAGARELITHLDALVADGAINEWAPRAFTEFARSRPLHAISTRGYPWIEIDYPDDYHRAVSRVLPLIESRRPATPVSDDSPAPAGSPARDTGAAADWRPRTNHV